jgi:hypothetical protein
MSNTIRDIILILIAAGLLVAVLVPARKDSDAFKEESNYESSNKKRVDDKPLLKSSKVTSNLSKSIASPAKEDIEHKLFPVAEGSLWQYRVTGADKYVPDELWTIQITRIPTEKKTGEIVTGFGQNRQARPFTLKNGTLKIDSLPLFNPLNLKNLHLISSEGRFLPKFKYIIKDAVWNLYFKLDFLYLYTDKKGKEIKEQATAYETNRAMAGEKEEIITPYGIFNAVKINWLGRVEIKTQKSNRKVLKELTTRPYREEAMWFAPGIGMIRRKIVYLDDKKNPVFFDLIRYHRP